MPTENDFAQFLRDFRATVVDATARLREIPAAESRQKNAPDDWAPIEILGHLVDSAANNHQRIVRAQLEDNPAMPGYAQQAWVDLHGYKRREWRELIELWRALNQQLLAAAEAVPESARSRTCTIAGSEPLTIEFVFEDYLEHMLHHLQHIGIDVADLRSGAVAAD